MSSFILRFLDEIRHDHKVIRQELKGIYALHVRKDLTMLFFKFLLWTAPVCQSLTLQNFVRASRESYFAKKLTYRKKFPRLARWINQGFSTRAVQMNCSPRRNSIWSLYIILYSITAECRFLLLERNFSRSGDRQVLWLQKKNQLVRVSKSVARELRYTETILAVAYKLIHPEHWNRTKSFTFWFKRQNNHKKTIWRIAGWNRTWLYPRI